MPAGNCSISVSLVLLAGVVIEARQNISKCLSHVEINGTLVSATHVRHTYDARGSFWLMGVQRSSICHFSSIVILFSFFLQCLTAVETNLLKLMLYSITANVFNTGSNCRLANRTALSEQRQKTDTDLEDFTAESNQTLTISV